MRSFAKRLFLVSSIGVSLTLASISMAAELKNTAESTASSYELFDHQHQYSLISLTKVEHTPNKSCKVVKRNELYELSAILSDKIHVFLAYFDSKPKYQIVEKEEDKNALSMNRS